MTSSALPTPMRDADILREHQISDERAIAEVERQAGDAAASGSGGGITTSHSVAVAQLVDQIDMNPSLFAIRYLNLEATVRELAARVSNLDGGAR